MSLSEKPASHHQFWKPVPPPKNQSGEGRTLPRREEEEQGGSESESASCFRATRARKAEETEGSV